MTVHAILIRNQGNLFIASSPEGSSIEKPTGKSLREIGGHVHLNHRQLSRGVKAMEENRDAGVNGRPQSLNEEGVAIFVETIRKRMSVRVNTTHQEARELVIKIIPSFF